MPVSPSFSPPVRFRSLPPKRRSRPPGLLLSLALACIVNTQCHAKEDQRAREVSARVEPRLTKALQVQDLRFGAPVFIRIFKEERQLELWVKNDAKPAFELFRTYRIAAMSGTLGPKLREGDRQAPEGFYYVPRRKMNPRSNFHLSFNVGYPNEYDLAHERDGSFIMVHGHHASIGCFAMTDKWIEEIYTLCDAALDRGQRFFRVHIFPFRMSAERIAEARSTQTGRRWATFWQNLKEGYDAFEKTRIPPNVEVENKRYVIDPP